MSTSGSWPWVNSAWSVRIPPGRSRVWPRNPRHGSQCASSPRARRRDDRRPHSSPERSSFGRDVRWDGRVKRLQTCGSNLLPRLPRPGGLLAGSRQIRDINGSRGRPPPVGRALGWLAAMTPGRCAGRSVVCTADFKFLLGHGSSDPQVRCVWQLLAGQISDGADGARRRGGVHAADTTAGSGRNRRRAASSFCRCTSTDDG